MRNHRKITSSQERRKPATGLVQRSFGMFIILGVAACLNFSVAHAQYFQLHRSSAKQEVIVADGLDSVLFVAMTPFDLPRTPDSVEFTYHEPMPDSIMPRSAMVVGTVTVQSEEPDELVSRLEKFARQSGADWIVSFTEPRVFHDKAGNRLFRSSAQLLRVLDPTLIKQTDLQYSYYETSKLHDYAGVTKWFDSFGRQMGAQVVPTTTTETADR